ncbi:protein of unknown function [Cupriavidus neocaledonicus]|uniref:Uncharacterized protein n=1 Tax=Cupriavidus neocaledonicus TaxID=1040979 RepID=A0A375HB30_9BURK|nr:protein of unknown function [Cupriavidus neocaledonicus]
MRHFPAAMSASPRQGREARNYTIDLQWSVRRAAQRGSREPALASQEPASCPCPARSFCGVS